MSSTELRALKHETRAAEQQALDLERRGSYGEAAGAWGRAALLHLEMAGIHARTAQWWLRFSLVSAGVSVALSLFALSLLAFSTWGGA